MHVRIGSLGSLGDVPPAQRTFWKRAMAEIWGWPDSRINSAEGDYMRATVEQSLAQEASRYAMLGGNDGFSGYFAGRPDVYAVYISEYGGTPANWPFAERNQINSGTWQTWHQTRAEKLAAEGYVPPAAPSATTQTAVFGGSAAAPAIGPVSAPASAPANAAPGYGGSYTLPRSGSGSGSGSAAPPPSIAYGEPVGYSVAPFPTGSAAGESQGKTNFGPLLALLALFAVN